MDTFLLVQALKASNVEFIVAPFEADAQMAYLAVNNVVHSVITEDSDLLPYGCPRVRLLLALLARQTCINFGHDRSGCPGALQHQALSLDIGPASV